ncbi:MAG: hypothetical protein WAM73_15550 [Desulfobacterales bacterium]
MRNNVKKRWTMVAVVWAGVLVLNFWTMDKIDRIQEMRTQKEILERDHQFWKDNGAQISAVLHRHSLLTQNVASLKLGLLQLENSLRVGALHYHLEEVTFVSQPEAAGEESLPIKLSFVGSPNDAIRWLDSMRDNHACLKIRNLHIALEPLADVARVQVTCDYRFSVSTAENAT